MSAEPTRLGWWTTYAFLDLELGTDQTPLDTVKCNLELKTADSPHVYVNLDPGGFLVPRLLDDGRNLIVSRDPCQIAIFYLHHQEQSFQYDP